MTLRKCSTATGLPERDFRAIRAFLIRSTVPLIFQDGDVAGVHGSGSLFDFEGFLYFVTAGHVLQDVDPTKLGVPLGVSSSSIGTLGIGQFGWSRAEEYDVAAYRIDDPEVAADLRDAYTVLGVANVGAPDPLLDDYVVVGYPASTVTRSGYTLTAKDLTQIHTTPYMGEVTGNKGHHDLFLELSAKGRGLWGEDKPLPALPGISGGPVWQLRSSRSDVWTPESSLALVGIQVSTDLRAERYIRALRWDIVQAAIRGLAPNAPLWSPRDAH